MPTSSVGSAKGIEMTDHKELASALYARCLSDFPPDHLFYQQDLLNLGIIPKNDLSLLMKCAQSLVDQSLMRILYGNDDRLAWKIIAQADAEKLQNLNAEERLIYSVVESTGRVGVWTRTIKTRTNLHQTIVNRSLKSLETKNYIKSVRNVKYPQRKMYMLSGLQPSEDVTGGAWFTDGVLDVDFIRGIGGWIEHWVSSRSWFDQAAAERKAKRQKVRQDSSKGEPQYIPYLPSYSGYPTVTDITNAINNSGLTPVTMGESSISQLLEMLCFDGKLISLRDGAAYKSVKKPNQISLQRELGLQTGDKTGENNADQDSLTLGGNGMTEAPCGRCPVFTLCQEGGPVNAKNCEYFDEWLKKSMAF
ncbi:DNA-directed RNA polymerase III subunit RPC6 [Paracoccidioides lutzii Pb01]|uniref:DNA-directed RNA polymerase III subunit RPC6 n=1 Tax=Paracoccidioides lutzii (strain ATCC MYA-826 / Pb01) TaxID=502779 RepID=C1H7R9_PARBA|nr:DNA-directed RNA polymerase III subunit RPC6 [Paracoccidioides lutzii Pb01]EEH36392.1 DNA-directed RNA polymerase III subunit RPC6 [Paracoccidioides lutzii Pb01]